MDSSNSPRSSAAAERTALIRRYTLILGLAYGVLVAAALGFFMLQIQERERAEWRSIAGRVKEHALILDALAGAVADRVQELQADSVARAVASAPDHPEDDPVELDADGRLSFRPGGIRPVPPTAAIAGSVDLAVLSEARGEILDAVRLLDDFRYLVTLLPIVERAYYISRRGFAVLLPSTPAEAANFRSGPLPAVLLDAVARERDPTRRPVWLDGSDLPGGGGRIVHLAPVDRDGRLIGAIGLEVSTPYLNRVNGDFDYPVGTTLLLGPDGTVLAFPSSHGETVTLGSPVGSTLPAELAIRVEKALALADRQFEADDGALLYVERLEAAPWTLVYVGERWSVLRALILDHGPQTLALVAILTVMLLIAGGLTRREFVDPASRLVEHIKAAGEIGGDGPPRVPIAWRPWFRTVTAVFRENADLVRLRQELQIARDMQASVLPRQPLRHRDLGIVGRMKPALEVGGDFYDYFRIDDDRVGIVIADVSGKGVPASLFMMVTRTLLKAAGLSGDGPGACLSRVNDLLEAENDAAMFVTVFYGVIDIANATLVYANGGHNPPLLLQADGSTRIVEPLGDPILAVVPGTAFKEARLSLGAGDALLLYTDGLTEAFSAAGEEFGDARLVEALAGCKGQSSAGIADQCLAAVEAFASGAAQSDDMTCLVARIEPSN